MLFQDALDRHPGVRVEPETTGLQGRQACAARPCLVETADPADHDATRALFVQERSHDEQLALFVKACAPLLSAARRPSFRGQISMF